MFTRPISRTDFTDKFAIFVFLNSVMAFLYLMESANVMYLYVPCYILLIVSAVLCVSALIKNIRERCVKGHQIVFSIAMIMFCAILFGKVPNYTKDIFGGTVSVTTEYYRPYREEMIICPENEESVIVYCTEKQSAPLLEKFSFDKSRTIKISDNISAYPCTPKVTIIYYSNSRLVKEIVLHEE